MKTKSIDERLRRLERSRNISPYVQQVRRMIDAGLKYSDLTDAEKEIYARYHGAQNHIVYEQVEKMVCGVVAEELCEKEKPMTIEETTQEIERIIANTIL